MKLSQIDLRTTYQSTYSERFNPESWAIPELYWSLLKNYSTPSVQKINIFISDDWENSLTKPMKVVGFKEAFIDFDFAKYFSLEKHEKKKLQLDAVHKGMMEIAAREGWAVDPLLDAYNACLAKGLQYRFEAGKPKSSPDRRYKIGFWCDWDIDVFEVYWVLYDKSGKEMRREKLLEKPPYEGEFMYYAKWKWHDNHTVLLEDKYKYGNRENWKIELGNVLSL